MIEYHKYGVEYVEFVGPYQGHWRVWGPGKGTVVPWWLVPFAWLWVRI